METKPQMPSKTADLHIHSTFSDSDSSVQEIFRQAKEKNLACISLTDHDTVAGLGIAREQSLLTGVELVNGIEISAQYKDSEVHILGYFIDPQNPRLVTALEGVKIMRKERLTKMADKLLGLGLKIDKEELFNEIGDVIPTRLHLARYMMKKGLIANFKEAFKKYLSPRCPAYVTHIKYQVEEAINIIKEAGGLSFLAHPHMLAQQEWIEVFINCGIDGLEIGYSNMSHVKRMMYEEMIARFDLLSSGGSDAHGSYKEFTRIGGVTVPYEWVERMKKRLEQRAGKWE
jgi:hypothetical protein